MLWTRLFLERLAFLLRIVPWLPWILITAQEFYPEVPTRYGIVKGILIQPGARKNFYAFRGIPYATPPVGLLRFQPPVEHSGWRNTLDATEYRSVCPQYDSRRRHMGSEDCLFINVFTPVLSGRTNGGVFPSVTNPVMVFIHGGQFERGSGNILDFGPEKLTDKGIVVVTFNYRLGVLGFLSTETEDSSGNWGLLDQLLAIRWVRNNIERFGGDPNAVTLFGQGAGAASVSLHVISPLSRGLFRHAILQSGSALCDWAIERNPLQYAKDVARRVECPVGRTSELVDCLRQKPFASILLAQSELKSFGDFPMRAVPVIERAGASRFLPEDPYRLISSGIYHRISLMAGVNRDEGALFYPMLANHYRDYLRNNASYVKDVLLKAFLETATHIQGNLDAVAEALMFEYFSHINTANTIDVPLVVKAFINMSTDALYVACTDLTLQMFSNAQIPTYMYTFEYRGVNSFLDLEITPPTGIDPGVSHGDELLYLFNLTQYGLKPTPNMDNFVSDRMVTLWTDFAKYGKAPHLLNYEYPRWDSYRDDRPYYYKIDRELKLEVGFRQRGVDLWLRHLPSLARLVPPTTSPLIQSHLSESLYRTLAWAMVAVSIALLVLVVVLLTILYNQKRSQSFKASPESQSRISGSTLY